VRSKSATNGFQSGKTARFKAGLTTEGASHWQLGLRLTNEDDLARVLPMFKPIALAFLLAWQLGPFCMIQNGRADNSSNLSCQGEAVSSGFTRAIVFNLDPPLPDGIRSVVGGDYAVVRGVLLIVNGTLYTAVFDPPLEQRDGFATLSKDQRIPARVEGNYLLLRLPDGKEAKAKIIRHESLRPNQPQSA